MTTKVRPSTLDVTFPPGSEAIVGGPQEVIATANTVNLLVAELTTQNIAFTGTISIAGFQASLGKTFFCKALSDFRLLHSSLIACPASKDITVRAGDSFIIRATGANIVQILGYSRSTESNNTSPAACRLVYVDSATITLTREGGTTIPINGVDEIIPFEGVSLAPTGLTPDTIYYIYAYMSAGSMLLEASATGHTPSTVTGVEIKIADGTRTLVGMVRPATGPVFVDSDSVKLVASWYNRRITYAEIYITSDFSIASLPDFESITDPVEFIAWGEPALAIAHFNLSNSSATGLAYTAIAGILPFSRFDTNAATANLRQNGAISGILYYDPETYLSIALEGKSTASTTTWYADELTVLTIQLYI